jgi:hypothetical protein
VVVIEERRLRGVAFVRETVLCGHLFEGRHTVLVESLVDVQLVRATLARDIAGVADVDVEQAIAVHVGHGHSRGPVSFAAHPGFIGDVLELEMAFVEVEFISVQVRREHHLRETVTIEVADRHATAVVEIAVGEDVHLRCVLDAIDEAHPRITRGHHREKMVVDGRSLSC